MLIFLFQFGRSGRQRGLRHGMVCESDCVYVGLFKAGQGEWEWEEEVRGGAEFA